MPACGSAGYDHHPIAECGDPEVAEDFLPIIHLVFANLKTWLTPEEGVGRRWQLSYSRTRGKPCARSDRGEDREGSVAMGPHLGRKKLIVLTFERKPTHYGEKVRAKIEPPPSPRQRRPSHRVTLGVDAAAARISSLENTVGMPLQSWSSRSAFLSQ